MNHSLLTLLSGFVSGSSADPRYNLSYIVKTASDIGKPIIAVSFNYRLAGMSFYGFVLAFWLTSDRIRFSLWR